ncbi:MAG: N(4)-(beta-N-acetylglucosaminyl)-L-asparaginase [Candidatus Brockarchaeota archaeon]|nr:N(4)-(beta-N-acetylglucosaminyl)-L-asparaginase [Candidatus Brockarchaeota archaeon]MBO3768711.1 N(4)-(beta-N-acetylglucosaminyl)-L-asparaginase [Candidatus Brockarchaeota archaeon]
MPTIIATWNFGIKAVETGWKVLSNEGSALDAVEAGIREVENDLSIHSVGLGGYPNIEGVVELDAAIMDGSTLSAGSVAAVRNVRHPIILARKVMENTSHVMIVGEGATKLAKIFGLYVEEVKLQQDVKLEWEKFKESLSLSSKPNSLELLSKALSKQIVHDTIGCVAIDKFGRIAAGTSTSGLKFKLTGRVGDSPIVGSGLFANSFGGATATGLGENIMIHNLSRLVVERISEGLSAREAVKVEIERITKNGKRFNELAVIALDKNELFGAASTFDKFEFVVMSDSMKRPTTFKLERKHTFVAF